ncbi:chloride channel protein [Deferribacter autotrophicus]|uniref:Chloride channel protein n=1 Tax=Deferribacter autotrophicus TaxID=500465 RepID=A0A5A8F730_9BACT|nr:chloride channel protein [Deferribacter autotrophicus]KAA0259099.1 chloride channel protein [Deferribacter autotrophicus]
MNNFLKNINFPIIGRWFILGTIVGIIAGLGAILFFILLQGTSYFFLDYLTGLRIGETGGEPSLFGHATTEFKRWMLFLVPTFGGLLSGFIVYKFAPEAEGHGTDAAIEAIHFKNGYIRWQVPIVKTIASAITIGTGGSGGREGPIAQIGAGFASFLGRKLNITDREKRILTAAGMGAGVGAIFRSPLAGAIFAAEVLYSSSDLEAEVLLPSTITSIIAYSIFCSIFGWDSLFLTPDFRFTNPLELFPYTILGFACALFGYLYVNIFYKTHQTFKDLKISNYMKPVIGGFLTGIIGFFIPQALGGGYANIEKAMHGELALGFLFILIFAKIFSTSFSIGSGGSAGIFGPSMVIGASVGGFMGLVLEKIFPTIVSDPGAYALVGMAGFFAGIANTPLSTIIMVSEMTGNYHLLVPAMWVSSLSFLILRNTTIYKSQVRARSDSPIHKGEFFIQILQEIKVGEIMRNDPIVIRADMHFKEILEFIPTTKHNSFPVITEDNKLVGVLRFEEIREFVFEEGLEDIVVAGEICDTETPVITPDATLADAIETIGFKNIELLPVVNNKEEKKLEGIITRRDIITIYNKEMMKQKKREEALF